MPIARRSARMLGVMEKPDCGTMASSGASGPIRPPTLGALHARSASGGRIAGRLRLALVLALLILIVSPAAQGEGEEPQLAPLFTLRNLDGEEVSLVDYRGHVVILDFWASWCDPCTRTFPDIHALEQAYAERGVVLLVLCFDKREEDAREYLIAHEYATGNVLWGSLEETRAVKSLYGVEAVTHSLVIDRDGYIRFSGHPIRLTAEILEPWL